MITLVPSKLLVCLYFCNTVYVTDKYNVFWKKVCIGHGNLCQMHSGTYILLIGWVHWVYQVVPALKVGQPYVLYVKILIRVNTYYHRLRTPGEEIAFTARPTINSQSQIFRYGGSIFCLPHRPNFSDIFDLYLHWVSVVRALKWNFQFWVLEVLCYFFL